MNAHAASVSLVLLLAQPIAAHHLPVLGADGLVVNVSLPEKWRLSRQGSDDSWNTARAVVFAANDIGDDSLIVGAIQKDSPGGKQISFGPESFEAALRPGTVYVECGYIAGGPPATSPPYAWTDEEKPATAIKSGLRSPDKSWTTASLMTWRITFVHWGLNWQAFVAARPPYSKRDLDQAFSILESLQFPDIPVVHPRQAAEVAIPALSPEFREQFLPDPKCGCCRRYAVDTVVIAQGFHVTFTLLDAQTGKPLQSQSVDVARDGRATRP